MRQRTEAEDLLKQLYDLEKAKDRTPRRLTSKDLGLSPDTLECLQSELEREGFIEPRSLELTESACPPPL